MKISVKTKLAAGGAAALLMLAGIGVLVWHSHRPEQEMEPPKFAVQQSAQQVSRQSLSPDESGDDSITNRSGIESPDKQNAEDEEKQAAEFLALLDSLEAYSQTPGMAQSNPDSTDADEKKNAEDEAARLEHEQKVEAARQQVIDTILARADELEWFRTHARNERDSKVIERHIVARRDLGFRLIAIDIPNYVYLTKDVDAKRSGGWIYELCIENGFTIGPDPYEVVKRRGRN